MIYNILFANLLLSPFATAKDLPGEEIYTAPSPSEITHLPPNALTPSQNQFQKSKMGAKITQDAGDHMPSTQIRNLRSSRSGPPGLRTDGAHTLAPNLPSEYGGATRQSTQSELVLPPKGAAEILRPIKVGDSIALEVEHSVIAFPDEKAPVIAKIESGPLRGIRFIGESTLEPNTHRIFINFSRVIQNNRIFDFKGIGITAGGQPGFQGEYHSREAEFFGGDFIASFTAGYFDGLVPRHTNAFGQAEIDNTVDAAVKKGLSSGALSTADRFREKLKKVPEFSELKGPFPLKILILDQPKTTN